jgi:ADP-ribose pyrophosphatase YjhB (NUDIX family)
METFQCHNNCCTLKIKPYIEQCPEKFRLQRKKSGVFICDPKTNKILIVQSCGHLWGPPKGTLEEGETEIQCALREVLEETGLDIPTEILSKPFAIYNNATYFYLEMNECEVTIPDTHEKNDANGIAWIKIECLEKCIEIGNINISKHFRLLFKKLYGSSLPHSSFLTVNRKKSITRSELFQT